ATQLAAPAGQLAAPAGQLAAPAGERAAEPAAVVGADAAPSPRDEVLPAGDADVAPVVVEKKRAPVRSSTSKRAASKPREESYKDNPY
ncbi:hypothetical protein L6R52_23655, partial [Myxococcota bacterium]|nr:hypothetical protein [Myxococcota bacterium]